MSKPYIQVYFKLEGEDKDKDEFQLILIFLGLASYPSVLPYCSQSLYTLWKNLTVD